MKKTGPKSENVRKVTSTKANIAIDKKILLNIRNFEDKSPEEISQRIKQLDKEWDIERVLALNMSALAICGITSSLIFNIYSIILPILVLLFFIWHAFQGWCPPIPILRYFKVRTRPEIDREKYALKALRGDFEGLSNAEDAANWAFESTKKI